MFRFRPSTPADRAACLAVFDSGVPEFLHPDERADFEAWLDAPEGHYLVLEVEGEVVGCGGHVVDETGELRLTWGLLRADHRGRGLGELLLVERLVRGAENGAQGVRRCGLATSPRVEPFFARVGFRRIGYQPDGWGPGMDRVDMRLELDVAARAALVERRVTLGRRRGAGTEPDASSRPR